VVNLSRLTLIFVLVESFDEVDTIWEMNVSQVLRSSTKIDAFIELLVNLK